MFVILLLIMIGGSISYFDLISMTDIFGEQCRLSTNLECTDFAIDEDSISLTIHNRGKGMHITNIQFESQSIAGDCGSGPIATTLLRGGQATFQTKDVESCNILHTDKAIAVDVKIQFSWHRSSISRFIEGELLSKGASGTIIRE